MKASSVKKVANDRQENVCQGASPRPLNSSLFHSAAAIHRPEGECEVSEDREEEEGGMGQDILNRGLVVAEAEQRKEETG